MEISLDKSISMLQIELAATRSSQEMRRSDEFTHISELTHEGLPRKKAFIVIGINTAFSSRKRHDSVVEFALALQEARCFSVVPECVLAPVAAAAAAATFSLRILTIGIGVGPFCIGQVN
ncbi:hypothetical protein HYC85_007092 [Camellia sinensis]|uniref:3-methyl-2-oxobutanoate hydroxymethyltransferase n=1 Tax=Camellia sinensis TaxID=4442 RepID=A0A7J7HQF7_CAMSI|nr:hypothetical protein HYC85_007092 [Camellia sinensis]